MSGILAADANQVGVFGLVGAAIVALFQLTKGLLETAREWWTLRKERSTLQNTEKVSFIQLTQEAMKDANSLQAAQLRATAEALEKTQGELEDARSDLADARQEIWTLTETVHQQAVTIARLDERIRELEAR